LTLTKAFIPFISCPEPVEITELEMTVVVPFRRIPEVADVAL
jgi:hypothetical protein